MMPAALSLLPGWLRVLILVGGAVAVLPGSVAHAAVLGFRLEWEVCREGVCERLPEDPFLWGGLYGCQARARLLADLAAEPDLAGAAPAKSLRGSCVAVTGPAIL